MRGVRLLGTFVLAASLALGGLVGFGIDGPVSAQTPPPPPSCVSVPKGLNTLQRAINDPANQDVTCFTLVSGEYTVDLTLTIARSVTITGVGEPGVITVNTDGTKVFTPSGSIIRPVPGKRIGVVAVSAGAAVTIDGVTITGGNTRNSGGGVLVASGGTLELRNSTISSNAAVDGAGIENNGVLRVNSSTIFGNVASKKGGGIRSQGSTTIVNSTFEENVASQGGALSTPGSAKVVHSTIVENKATSSSSAGVDRNGGTLQIFYSIIGDNRRTNGSTAADCSGTPDLIGFNLVTDSSGCNPIGPIDDVDTGALGLAALADKGGATLTRAVEDASPALDRTFPPAPNGDVSCVVSAAKLDEYGLDPVGFDQRGIPRPTAPGCADLGAFELARFGVENFQLDVNTQAYVDRGYVTPKVEVGVTSVSVDDIAGALSASPPADNGSVESSGVRNVGVRNVTVQNIGVRNVGVRNVGVRNVGVRNVGVRNVGVRNIGVRNVFLSSPAPEGLGLDTFLTSIPLSEIPLLASPNRTVEQGGDNLGSVPDGWAAYLAGTQYDGLPLQSLTLDTLDQDRPAMQPVKLPDGTESTPKFPYRLFEDITLEDLDLTNSVLGAIELRSAALADFPLAEIPKIPARDALGNPILGADGKPTFIPWCVVFADLCKKIGADRLEQLDLLSVQLAGEDVDTVDVAAIDLPDFVSKLKAAGVRNVGVRNVGLQYINLQNSGVRNVGVRNVGVRNVALIVTCENPDYYKFCAEDNAFTLGDIPPEAFRDTATVGQLFDMIDPLLLKGMSLADFLALFAPNEQVPWEQVDLESAQLQNFGDQPSFDYIAKFTVTGSAADTLEVELVLPKGFVLAARPQFGEVSELSDGTLTTAVSPTAPTEGSLFYEFAALNPGSYELTVPVLAGIVTGPNEAEARLTATGVTGAIKPLTDKATVEVVAARDSDGSGSTGVGTAGGLTFGDLQLAHIAGAGDVDVYEFEAPASGTAQVLLSNVPEGVDYDLSIYAPTVPTLRNGVSQRSLKTVGDVRYDLDPGDDVFPTDLADDVNLDVLGSLKVAGTSGYVLRDISSRRSNSDEEVELPAVVEGETYFVTVTSYLDDFSPRPYGIRVRINGASVLPACPAVDRTVGPDGAKVNLAIAGRPSDLPTFDPPGAGTKTLYLTNLHWLAATFPADDEIIDYVDIIDAAIATQAVDGVAPAIVDVSTSEAVRDAYQRWAQGSRPMLDVDDKPMFDVDGNPRMVANRCDPEVRNDVVRAIGDLLDEVQKTATGVENIVILGDDGIVPMAAVPDLTGYSNEATYARDVLTGGANNEVAGALGSGYLLSDDPYGTSAGIEIRNAGHQLYVPEVSVGRLVETGEEIHQQLVNFTEYDGQLDPGTLATPGTPPTASTPPTAAVTGYDFLTDGANAIVAGLEASGTQVATSIDCDPDVDPEGNRVFDVDCTPVLDAAGDPVLGGDDLPRFEMDLLGDYWTRENYLDLLQGGGPDIVSPNAHFDHEALLPAAPDTAKYYSDDELVFTSDIAAKNIQRSLAFTIGCHAGLSVSDVQVGFTSPDWAQTYAKGDNQWLAHTTYGYGDDEIVAYSERLAALFAGNVSDHLTGDGDAPVSLGQAMLRAKREYLATTFTLTPYDEKILQSWTYYGLPMYKIGSGSATEPTTTLFGDLSRSVTESGTSLLNDTSTAFGTTTQPVVVDDEVVELGTTSVTVNLSRTTGRSGPNNLNLVKSGDGDYYEVGGNVITAQHRPVQPLVDLAIPQETVADAAGFLITGLTSTDVRPFTPLYLRPTVDLSSNERRVEPGDGSFPANLQLVTDDADGSQHLLLAAGQFQGGIGEATGTQRLYTKVSGTLYHSDPGNPSDGIGPRFVSIDTSKAPAITVTTAEAADRVVVLYQPRNSSQWALLELTGIGTTWTGSLPVIDPANPEATVEFFVQAVDAQGDVSISDNKVENFFNSGDSDGGPLEITSTPEPGPEGFNNTDVTVKISAASEDDFDFVSIDSTVLYDAGLPSTGQIVFVDGKWVLDVTIKGDGTEDGNYVVFARDSSGSGQIYSVTVDTTDPTISAVDPPTTWSRGPVTVTFEAGDPLAGAKSFASGVASITYTVTHPDGTETTGVGGPLTEVPVTSEGVTTVTAFATDAARNRSAQDAVVEVRIDNTAPTVDIATVPTEGWAQAFNVVLSDTSQKDLSPTTLEFQITGAVATQPTSVDKCAANAPLTTSDCWLPYPDGGFQLATEATAVWARATDAASNASAVVGPEIPWIDRTPPTWAVSIFKVQDGAEVEVPGGVLQQFDEAYARFTCDDEGRSGVKACPDRVPLDTSSIGPGTATVQIEDNVGNKATASAPYSVGYRVCELYDSTKPANAGSNYTIKVQICDAQGRPTPDNGSRLLVLTAIEVIKADGTEYDILPSFSGGSNAGYEFRYSAKDKQYVYNLSTSPEWGVGDFQLGFVVTAGSIDEDVRKKIDEDNGSTNFAGFTLG